MNGRLTHVDPGQQLVDLGVQLLDLVRNGSRTTTYKPATLLALVDVLAVHADQQGRVPDAVSLEALGERVVALYWPQVREYDGLDRTGVVLRQISDRQKGSVILREVRELYELARGRGIRSPTQAALHLPDEHRSTVRRVTQNLARYPLARLQRPGGWREGQPYERLLYDDSVFGSERPRTSVLRLHAGVGERLLALSALLTPVLQSEWTQQVASLNALPSEDLRAHLFGRERSDLGGVREALRELQQGRCLYCAGALRGGGQVDHVVPWSLHPQDAIENLVLAHDRCNGSKSAYLLDLEPLSAWAERDLPELAATAAALGWVSAPGAVFSTARSAYAHSSAARLWSPAGTRLADPDELQAAFLPLLQAA